jgi:hypothetical protein
MALQTLAVFEMSNPAKGTATITHDPLGGLPDSVKRKLRTIYLDAPPWNHTGRQPYAWDYTAPADWRLGFGVLTLVLDRNVRMLWDKADWFGGYFGPDNPRLVVIRVQDSSLVPPPDAPILAHQLVRPPYPWASARDDTTAWWLRPFTLRNARSTQSATVIPFENGVSVRHDGGEFEFRVTAPITERAAFAYEIIFPHEYGYWFRCVHTPNVEISGWLTRDFDEGIPQVFVEHAVVHRIDQVPAQGAVLSPDKFRFEYFTDFKIRFSASTRRAIWVLETVIGFIPVIGALYDAAQLVYTVANGKTFWGETAALSEDEICVQGLCAILNVALSAAEVTSAIRKVIKARPKLAPALDKGVADAVRQHLDQRIIDGFKDLSSEDQKKLVAALKAYATGELDALGLLSILNQGIADKIKTLTDEERALANLLSEDLKGFRASDIQDGYQKYVSKKGASRTPLGPLEWALKQTTGRYVELLSRELGRDLPTVRRVISGLQRKAVKTVTTEALALIERWGAAVHHYRDLRRVAKGYGDFYQVDHLFEKRFWKSPRLNDIIDQSDFMAMIVAKDPQVAAQIKGYRSYVHSQKTELLRRLIPHGEEDFFTMQQWWDAHVHVGRQVGIPESVLKGELRDEFKFLLEHSDHPEKIDFRFNQKAEDFLPSNWRRMGAAMAR